jgi:hypothetical protein
LLVMAGRHSISMLTDAASSPASFDPKGLSAVSGATVNGQIAK